MSVFEKAKSFARNKHSDQLRKYTFEPYVNHCLNVAQSVSKFTDDQDIWSAAVLHDTVEDTDATIKDIDAIFGYKIASLVHELTDLYTKENYPELNRGERKFLEAYRLEKISNEAKLIKYFDIMDNSSTIFSYDTRFAKTYLKEKQFILSYSLNSLEF